MDVPSTISWYMI